VGGGWGWYLLGVGVPDVDHTIEGAREEHARVMGVPRQARHAVCMPVIRELSGLSVTGRRARTRGPTYPRPFLLVLKRG